MAYTGWSTTNYFSRNSNYPAINAFTAAATVWLNPAWTGFNDIFELEDTVGITYRAMSFSGDSGPVGLYSAHSGSGGTVPVIGAGKLSIGWWTVVATYTGVVDTSWIYARKLGTTAVLSNNGNTRTIDSGWTPNSFAIGCRPTVGQGWPGPLGRVSIWNTLLSPTEIQRELYSLVPTRRLSLLLDWRGWGVTDYSGTTNLTANGTLTAAAQPQDGTLIGVPDLNYSQRVVATGDVSRSGLWTST